MRRATLRRRPGRGHWFTTTVLCSNGSMKRYCGQAACKHMDRRQSGPYVARVHPIGVLSNVAGLASIIAWLYSNLLCFAIMFAQFTCDNIGFRGVLLCILSIPYLFHWITGPSFLFPRFLSRFVLGASLRSTRCRYGQTRRGTICSTS